MIKFKNERKIKNGNKKKRRLILYCHSIPLGGRQRHQHTVHRAHHLHHEECPGAGLLGEGGPGNLHVYFFI